MKKDNPYDIIVSEKDLRLDDHSLFIKIFDEIHSVSENPPDFDVLQEDITKIINLARNRVLCSQCQGYGMIKGLKCFNIFCNGSGYIS